MALGLTCSTLCYSLYERREKEKKTVHILYLQGTLSLHHVPSKVGTLQSFLINSKSPKKNSFSESAIKSDTGNEDEEWPLRPLEQFWFPFIQQGTGTFHAATFIFPMYDVREVQIQIPCTCLVHGQHSEHSKSMLLFFHEVKLFDLLIIVKGTKQLTLLRSVNKTNAPCMRLSFTIQKYELKCILLKTGSLFVSSKKLLQPDHCPLGHH